MMSPTAMFGRIAGSLTRILHRLAAPLFWVISLFIPRSRYIWAFGSWYGERFADNPKYFFLHCSTAAQQHVHTVWLSANRSVVQRVRGLGFNAHHRFSPKGLWYSLRAGVWLIDCRVMDVSPVASRGAVIVNLWHGVPLKKIEADIEQSSHPCIQARKGSLPVRIIYRLARPQFTERYDFILATSAGVADRFQSAFAVGPEQIITVGFPRNDPLLSEADVGRYVLPKEHDLIGELQQHARERRRVLLYMPTFRDWSNVPGRSIPIDWTGLDTILQANGGILYCKLHPSDQSSLPPIDGYRNIRVIDTRVDPYPILTFTDALISDYSSIFIDYLLLDRPFIFYPYDLEEYQSLSRTLYDPYDQVTPGPKARTAKEFGCVVETLLRDYDGTEREWREARARARSRFHKFVDNKASERLVSALLERLVV